MRNLLIFVFYFMTSHQLTKSEQHIATRQSKYNSPSAQRLQSDYLALPSLHLKSASGRPLDDRYSYFRFSGPVSGQVKKVIVPGLRGKAVDYVAKPDYKYTYGVHDGDSQNSHAETRNGDSVLGEYRVLQSDGLVRIVRYTADPTSGFKATVEYVH